MITNDCQAGLSCAGHGSHCHADMVRGTQPLFELGRVVATPGALALLAEHGVEPLALLQRHVCGDWGAVSDVDAKANDEAVHQGTRLLSSYRLTSDAVIWLITEADRSATTLLRPAEY